jgi:hypothetical protein
VRINEELLESGGRSAGKVTCRLRATEFVLLYGTLSAQSVKRLATAGTENGTLFESQSMSALDHTRPPVQ